MSAHEFFTAGRLSEAIESQLAEVKARPTDPEARFFLVGLLVFAGQPDRAETHLDFLCHQDEEFVPLAQLIRSMLNAEEERRRVHEGGHRPGVAPENAAEVEARLELLAALAADRQEGAQALMQRLEQIPPVAGTINGQAWSAIANGDELLGPTLEVFADGRCLWVPLRNIRRLDTRPPKNIIDLLWLQAELVEQSGRDSVVHLPVRYAGTDARTDDQVRLGRVTEWDDVGVFRGYGQNTFQLAGQLAGELAGELAGQLAGDAPAVDGAEPDEISLLEIRTLVIGVEDAED
jgi:type VI secretion system protein ImpE